jgi:formate hydrogenlyase regulatory protein HycA
MTVPDLVPIRHEPAARTSTIGRWDTGQFFAHVSGVPAGRDAEGRVLRRWYSVLHEFDISGRHQTSRIQAVGVVADGPAKVESTASAKRLLDGWLDSLPGLRFTDIAIAPFAVEVDGTVFGLVRECHGEYPEGEERDDWAEFYPIRLGFSAPWDGTYDT